MKKNIKTQIESLELNGYFLIKETMDPNTFRSQGKVSLGRRDGSGTKKAYVSLIKEIEAEDEGMRPTVDIHVNNQEDGIRIQGTLPTYWLVAPTDDFDRVYPEVGAATDEESIEDLVRKIDITKGYTLLWDEESKEWVVFGYITPLESDPYKVEISRGLNFRAVNVCPVQFGDVMIYNCDTCTEEETALPGDEVDITLGEFEGNEVLLSTESFFTSTGDVYATGSLSTKHM